MTVTKKTSVARIPRKVISPYRVEFSARAHLDDWDEVEAITEVRGDIIHVGRNEEETSVGLLRGWCIRSARVTESGDDFLNVCDRAGQEMCDIAALVWDSGEDAYRDALELGMPIGDLLVPSTIEIVPEHRGKDVGLLTVWRFLDYFGSGATLAVLKPHPLHEHSEPALKNGIAKLKGHWSRLGFRPLPTSCSTGSLTASDFFFLDMAQMRPRLEDLLK